MKPTQAQSTRSWSLSFLSLLLLLFVFGCTGSPLSPLQCREDVDCAEGEVCTEKYCVRRPATQRPQIKTAFPQKTSENDRLFLVVRGTGFSKGAVVLFNGSPIQTTQGSSSGELLGELPRPSDGLHRLQVRLPDSATSLVYLLRFAKSPLVEALSFQRALRDCDEEILVVWGNNFWETMQASLRSTKDKQKEWKATEILQKSATEVRLRFTFSALAEGEYQLFLHNGSPSHATTRPFSIVKQLPSATLLNLSPRRFWSGSRRSAFVVGLKLQDTLVFLNDQPLRLFPVNRSTASLLLDFSDRNTNGKQTLRFRSPCAKESESFPLEVLGIPTPLVSSLSPPSLKLVDEEDVVLVGKNFHPDAQIWIDNQPRPTAKRVSDSKFQIPRSLFPSHGVYKIQVVNPGKKAGKVVTYQVSHTPTLLRVTPNYLSRSAPQKVTIEGRNLGKQVRVWINGKATDEIEQVSSQRLLLSSSLFPSQGKYTLQLENAGETSYRSQKVAHPIKFGPRIQRLNPPLVLLPLSQGELQVLGTDFDKDSTILLDGKVAEKTTFNEGALLTPIDLLRELGEHTIQVVNANGEKSNIVRITSSKVSRIALQEVKEVGELAYLCGVGVREEVDNRPRALMKRGGKTLLEVELFVSTFDTRCLYFPTSELRYLVEGSYQVQLCRDDVKGADCSNDYPWRWRGLPDLEPPTNAPPRLEFVRLLSPQSPVLDPAALPATLSFVIGGKHLRGTTEIRFAGKVIKPGGTLQIVTLSNQILVYNMPLPPTVFGHHAIEVTTGGRRSNTAFFRLEKEPFLQLYWTPQLFVPRDGEFNFQFYGGGLATSLTLWMDAKAVTLGGKPLSWSQFASQPPVYLSSFAWNEARKQAVGQRNVWLQSKEGLKSNSLTLPFGNSDQWGQEPLRLVAVDEPSRYQNSAGLAPASGESVALRLAYTGFRLVGKDGKTKGAVLLDGKPVTFSSGTTSLLGYSTVSLRTTRFSGAPRLLSLQLKNPDGKQSNLQFVTLVPPNSFRLTKIYNAADFSSILRPGKDTEIQIHGRGVTKEMKVYFAGKKLTPSLYYKNPETQDEFVRVSIDPGDLPPGQYPLWAVKDNASVSNTLLITVVREGIGGVPRVRSVNPLVWPLKALRAQGGSVRVEVNAVGLTEKSRLMLEGREYKLQQREGDRGIAVIDISAMKAGKVRGWIQDGASKSLEFTVNLLD